MFRIKTKDSAFDLLEICFCITSAILIANVFFTTVPLLLTPFLSKRLVLFAVAKG